jgi:hypothetical protein
MDAESINALDIWRILSFLTHIPEWSQGSDVL